MFDSAGKPDWPVPIGRDWLPTAIIEQTDLTGGNCELVAWDKLGNIVLWMGSAGRTQPAISGLAVGSFTLGVTNAGTPNAETTLQGLLAFGQTSLLKVNAYAYQWDIFDSVGSKHPFLEGQLTASGRPLP